jgi:anti-anti-sigma regulatory factor
VDKNIAYQVHDTPERCFIRVSDKASYLNCSPVRDFILNRLESGKTNFVVDFDQCKSIDSTFLGILVSLAIKVKSSGSLTLLNLRDRNLETVRNLGIHKIAIVSTESFVEVDEAIAIDESAADAKASTRLIYEAHKSLMDLNQKNQKLFCDVVKFLEQKKEEEG